MPLFDNEICECLCTAIQLRSVMCSVEVGFSAQVRLLKDILEAWKAEVEKKPPSMSTDEAYQTLNLSKDVDRLVSGVVQRIFTGNCHRNCNSLSSIISNRPLPGYFTISMAGRVMMWDVVDPCTFCAIVSQKWSQVISAKLILFLSLQNMSQDLISH